MSEPFKWNKARHGARGERAHYNGFYAGGGWSYDRGYERGFLETRILRPLGARSGQDILEIGCGRGLHAAILHDLGFRVTAVDVSDVAIRDASATHPGPRFIAADLEDVPLEKESFDLVFSRGMSWYHYELLGVNQDEVDVPERTRDLFALLRPGGVFVLQICTDFSGDGRGQGGVFFNTLDDYVALFARFGDIALLTNWNGAALRSQDHAHSLGGNVLIGTRKRRPHAPASLR